MDAITGDQMADHKMWRSGIVPTLEEDSHAVLLSDALELCGCLLYTSMVLLLTPNKLRNLALPSLSISILLIVL